MKWTIFRWCFCGTFFLTDLTLNIIEWMTLIWGRKVWPTGRKLYMHDITVTLMQGQYKCKRTGGAWLGSFVEKATFLSDLQEIVSEHYLLGSLVRLGNRLILHIWDGRHTVSLKYDSCQYARKFLRILLIILSKWVRAYPSQHFLQNWV